MKNEKFGSIMFDGKMIDLDRADINELKKVETKLKEKENNLKDKVVTIFKQ